MTKYEIRKYAREINGIRRESELYDGCALNDQEPETIEAFESLEKAEDALKKYRTSIYRSSYAGMPLYEVAEYAIEVNDYDEDGEWTGGGDIWAHTQWPDRMPWEDYDDVDD